MIVVRVVAIIVESFSAVVRAAIFVIGKVVIVVLTVEYAVAVVIMVGGAVLAIVAAAVLILRSLVVLVGVIDAVVFGVLVAPITFFRRTISFRICRRQVSTCFNKSCSWLGAVTVAVTFAFVMPTV